MSIMQMSIMQTSLIWKLAESKIFWTPEHHRYTV